MMLGGGLIERVNVRSTGVWKIPDNFAFEKAAAVPVNYGTTWFALHQRGNIQSGETVLVTGAAGGTKFKLAIQLAKATGAMVIAVAGGAEKTKQAEFLGADHVIDHQIKGDWVDEVRELSNGGVDIAYDPVGGDTTHQVRRCMAMVDFHYWVCCWDTRLTRQSYASQKTTASLVSIGGFLRKRSAVTEQSNAFNH